MGSVEYMNDIMTYLVGASFICIFVGGFFDKKFVTYGFIGIGLALLIQLLFYTPMGLLIAVLFLFTCALLSRNSQ